MPEFRYGAIEVRSGREFRGSVAGATREQVVTELKARGLAPTSLTVDAVLATKENRRLMEEKAQSIFRDLRGKLGKRHGIRIGRVVSRRNLTLFTRQLATLVKAGMPILRALEVLARPERNQAFKQVIMALAETIREGGKLSEGLQQYPKIFDALYVDMVKAGEAGGVLDTVLERLARLLERTERIKGRLKTAMTYPVVIMLVAGGILSGLMVFVVPKFEQIFSGMLKGQPLPGLTRVVLGASKFVSHEIAVIVALLILAWLSGRFFRATRFGARLVDWLLIKTPIMGDLLLKTSIARLTRTFGSLLGSGVPILEALTITRETSGNLRVAAALTVVHDRVKAGAMVAPSLEATAIFPGMVASMIEVGEATGALPDMLGRIADAYDDEVDNAVAALTSIIEPLMVVLMAVLVGVMVVALFLPIVGIIQHLQ